MNNNKDQSKADQNKQTLTTDYWCNKYKTQAARNWDLFYKRNKTNFFKDRHWTTKEFPQLSTSKVLLEIGCGVGNFLLPILVECSNLTRIYGCDFSNRAIEYIKQDKRYISNRCVVFVCDVTVQNVFRESIHDTVDVISMLFVLSAIPPEKQKSVIDNVFRVCRVGGCVVFRDYAVNDEAMLRKKSNSRLEELLYVRQDGTLAYYFTESVLVELFKSSGFSVSVVEIVERVTSNRKEGMNVGRVFVQATFIK